MVALQVFNDRVDTTFETVRSRLETVPVWTAEKRSCGTVLPEQDG